MMNRAYGLTFDQALAGVSARLVSRARTLKRSVTWRIRPVRQAWLDRQARGKIHWVSPARIHLMSLTPFAGRRPSEVVDGDWDQASCLFEDSHWHRACAAVVENEGHRSAAVVLQGPVGSGGGTDTELPAALHRVEALYRLACESGQSPPDRRAVVSVNIDRDGHLVLNEGRELLSVAKLLGLPSVPVVVVVRHARWMEFREEVRRDRRGPYSPVLHPDLEWLPSETGHERFDAIRSALVARRGRMLDIGCNWGYFCQRFEDIGFGCTGVEMDPRRYYFLEKLRRAGHYRFETVNASIFEHVSTPTDYDVVLALSILHHFIKTKDGVDQLRALLGRLRASEMFLMPARPSEAQMRHSAWNPSEEDFVAFVKEHSGLRRAVCLARGGRAETRRALYHLTA